MGITQSTKRLPQMDTQWMTELKMLLEGSVDSGIIDDPGISVCEICQTSKSNIDFKSFENI